MDPKTAASVVSITISRNDGLQIQGHTRYEIFNALREIQALAIQDVRRGRCRNTTAQAVDWIVDIVVSLERISLGCDTKRELESFVADWRGNAMLRAELHKKRLRDRVERSHLRLVDSRGA